ncbi:hypothetical protein M2459_001162 [Parabacteroides sp. PF5-5]|uniref:lipocalin-like domain-containing protein n=1 Tax=unclassified Parabacteroides TaxID=2649774 RepID=UPI00247389FF|nr:MULTISPECIES: lipocalin-like domain-containing protein [unclassified Parabacteroides]MDH6304429.1 hypothetical protein [Parabacteroides sp. PH5-39]MDH6315418.1 hypothetical protein [Parabacteroides sp. PF5-13]MDH6319088.1 hypothetical protein [Parabacteroides sp. PH5-13]MDH6322818.1 hypothetical protein [Parabacteroides sp. PH5-8]MDH6326610.1 hypothetical protein [Parabacteroides sp. PH5-41]
MKRDTILRLAFVCVALILFGAACSDENEDKLAGKWQMQEIESNGTYQKVDTIYYNFLTSLFQYQIYSPTSNSYNVVYGYKTLNDNKELLLEMEDASLLPHTDWTTTQRTFTIEKISNSQLILDSEGRRYTFRKF